MPQVTCPACSAVYDIPMLTLGGPGRKVRCAECKALFLAGPDEDVRAAAAEAQRAEAGNILISESMTTMVETPAQRLPWQMRIGALPRAVSTGVSPVALALVFAALVGTFIGLRKTVVAAVPETAVLYSALKLPVNLRGLELRDVKSAVFTEAQSEVLVVQGEIANITGKKQVVPPLAFTVRDAKGVAIYSWTASPDVTTLEPGAKATFRRRLASPPAEGMDVLVRFAGKPDQLALNR